MTKKILIIIALLLVTYVFFFFEFSHTGGYSESRIIKTLFCLKKKYIVKSMKLHVKKFGKLPTTEMGLFELTRCVKKKKCKIYPDGDLLNNFYITDHNKTPFYYFKESEMKYDVLYLGSDAKKGGKGINKDYSIIDLDCTNE